MIAAMLQQDPEMAQAHQDLARHLIMEKLIRTRAVLSAFLAVPRHAFLPADLRQAAYRDTPLQIGSGQTISAPHMCVMMLEALELTAGMRVLEVGTGSGYHAALCAEMVAPRTTVSIPSDLLDLLPTGNLPQPKIGVPKGEGHIFTIERLTELAQTARERLNRLDYCDRITVVHGDGSVGLKEHTPFDRILVTAAAPKVPAPLVDQLALGGIMIIPVGDRGFYQTLRRVYKTPSGNTVHEDLAGVAFVPLIGKEGWASRGNNTKE